MSEAKSEPGEGVFKCSRKNPSPALALLGHPLPQGEREEEAELTGRKPYHCAAVTIAGRSSS